MNTPPLESEILDILTRQSRSIRSLQITNAISCSILIVILFLPRFAAYISSCSNAIFDTINPHIATLLTILISIAVTIFVAAYIVSRIAPPRPTIDRPERNY